MKKILISLLIIVLTITVAAGISPVFAQEQPTPPLSPDEAWQPPIEGGELMEPPVAVEKYSQNWSNLQVSPPVMVAPDAPGSIVNAHLVNSYGLPLTNLYGGEVCYLVVSFNGPGYFYLWEYYPLGSSNYGHWLSYRWYRPYAGVWRIGPFSAEAFDPAGRYFCRSFRNYFRKYLISIGCFGAAF